MVGESSKPPHGKGSSEDKIDEKKDSKRNGVNLLTSPPSSSSSPSHMSSSSTTTTATNHSHSKTPKGRTALLKLDIKFELPIYNGEVSAKTLDNWIRQGGILQNSKPSRR